MYVARTTPCISKIVLTHAIFWKKNVHTSLCAFSFDAGYILQFTCTTESSKFSCREYITTHIWTSNITDIHESRRFRQWGPGRKF